VIEAVHWSESPNGIVTTIIEWIDENTRVVRGLAGGSVPTREFARSFRLKVEHGPRSTRFDFDRNARHLWAHGSWTHCSSRDREFRFHGTIDLSTHAVQFDDVDEARWLELTEIGILEAMVARYLELTS